MYLFGQPPYGGDNFSGHHYAKNDRGYDAKKKASNDSDFQYVLMLLKGRLFLDKVEGFLFVLPHHHMEGAFFEFHLVKTGLQIVQVIWQVFCTAVELGSRLNLRVLSLLVVDHELREVSVEFGSDQLPFNDVDCGHDAKAEEAAHHGRQHHERNQNPL